MWTCICMSRSANYRVGDRFLLVKCYQWITLVKQHAVAYTWWYEGELSGAQSTTATTITTTNTFRVTGWFFQTLPQVRPCPPKVLWGCWHNIFTGQVPFLSSNDWSFDAETWIAGEPCWCCSVFVRGMCSDEYLSTCCIVLCSKTAIEGLRERTEYIDMFLFSVHHSIVFCFQCSVHWWKGSVRF